MFVLFIRFQHLIFTLNLSISQFLNNFNVLVWKFFKRNDAISILIKIRHNLICQLCCFFFAKSILLDEIAHYFISFNCSRFVSVELHENSTKISLLLFIKLLLLFKFALWFEMFGFVSNILFILSIFLVDNGLKVISHKFCFFRILNSFFGSRMHVSVAYL